NSRQRRESGSRWTEGYQWHQLRNAEVKLRSGRPHANGSLRFLSRSEDEAAVRVGLHSAIRERPAGNVGKIPELRRIDSRDRAQFQRQDDQAGRHPGGDAVAASSVAAALWAAWGYASLSLARLT